MYHKETWYPIKNVKKDVYKEITILQAPDRPPPRKLSDVSVIDDSNLS
jgi:hypothetical protein